MQKRPGGPRLLTAQKFFHPYRFLSGGRLAKDRFTTTSHHHLSAESHQKKKKKIPFKEANS